MNFKPDILFIVLLFFGIQKLPLQQLFKVLVTYACEIEDDSNETADELIKKQLQIDELFSINYTTIYISNNSNEIFSFIQSCIHTSCIVDIESPPPNAS